MTLTRYKLGDLIKQHNERCANRSVNRSDISGVNRDKEFFPSRQVGSDVSNYKVVPAGYFACNLMHVGRDIVLPIAYNRSNHEVYVSPAYTVFCIKKDAPIDAIYLEMWFKSDERDRYFWMHTDSSIRDGMTYDDMCDIDIDLPSIEIQKKYVDIYKSMLDNQKCYERGLDDLKLTCDAYIENLRKDYAPQEIGKYLKIRDEQNSNMLYNDDDVMGVSQVKTIIPTKANTKGNDISKFTIIYPYDFVYNPRNGVAVGLNMTNNKYIISWNNTAFYISEDYKNTLKPEYLFMWLSRTEWDRKVKYDSWGSSTEVYAFDAMCDTKIPIPPMEIQDSIVNIFKSYDMRKTISLNIKSQILNLCPILIKGSLEEANK